ncbi:hypothetical protein [Nitratifractor sp.]
MPRIFLSLLLPLLFVSSLLRGGDTLLGTWTTQRTLSEPDMKQREVETVRFLPGTLRFELRVDLEKGPAKIQGLKLGANGLWKREGELLVIVLQEIRVEGIEDSKGINPASLKTLARELRQRYLSDPIRIYHIQALDADKLVLVDSRGESKSYRRE